MKFAYKGFNRAGQAVAETIDARDLADANDQLRRQNVYATEVRPADDAAPAARSGGKALGRGKRLKQVAVILRQLHVLIATGTPLAESLAALERQAGEPPVKQMLSGVLAKVEQGQSLAMAMDGYPDYFDAVCRGLVAAGESGGNLDKMLERLSVLTRKQVHTRSSIIGAMIYPALLTVVAVGVLTTLMLFVLPRFAGLFASLDTPLPPTTKFLMTISGLVRSYWWSSPLLVGGTIFGAVTVLKTPAGRRKLHWTLVTAPQFGKLVRSFETAKLTRLLGILLQGKVPLLDALELTRGATTNVHYGELLGKAGDAITRGESLAATLTHPRLIAASVSEAVRSGEKSGQLGTLLTTLADFLDEENDVTLRSLTSIVEPIILIVLGVLVGFIALSMFMPLFDLTAATGGG